MATCDYIKRVAISYGENKTDRVDFLFLAEYFRFTGVFVHEIARGKEVVHYTSIDYPIIWIQKDNLNAIAEHGEEQRGKIGYQRIKDEVLSYNRSKSFINIGLQHKKMLLTQLMDEIERRWSYVTPNRATIDIYVMNNIMLHSLSLQYYPKRASFAVEEAEKIFVSCYNEIGKYIEEPKQADRYMKYAYLWCAVKANNACTFLKWKLDFSIKDLEQKCIKLVNKFSDFNNARVLLGLCYEPANEYVSESVRVLERVLTQEGENSYTASVAYWLGKRYEAYEVNKEQAEDRYRQAYAQNGNYRSYYKIACIAKDKGMYEEACEEYERLVKRLLKKLKKGIMDPIEAEYVYKSLYRMARIAFSYMENCQQKVIQVGLEALRFRESLEQDEKFLYYDLYGEDWKRYVDISKERMSIKGICQMLADSFEILQKTELAKKYRDMIKG